MDPFTKGIPSSLRSRDDGVVTEVRERPIHLEATQSLPFEVAEVTFLPKNHPSLKAFILYIGIVHSLTDVMVLSAFVRLTEKGWSDRSPDLDEDEVQWRFKSYKWKDVVSQPKLIWKETMALGENKIKSYLKRLLPRKKDDQRPKEVNTRIEGATNDLGNPSKSRKT
jgi:hypothetical protein